MIRKYTYIDGGLRVDEIGRYETNIHDHSDDNENVLEPIRLIISDLRCKVVSDMALTELIRNE